MSFWPSGQDDLEHQVSLGGWNSPDYTAQQIIGRLDTVSRLIPVKNVIIGWSTDPEIYREGIVPTSAEYVTESLDAIRRHGFDGAVLSWNIMEAPEEHIACLKP